MPRLIDADILAESTCYGICAECDEMYKGKNVMTNCSEIRLMFLRLINCAPTVDIDAITESHEKIGYDKGFRDGYAQATVDAERHGHWINHYDDLFPECSTIECSLCHEHYYELCIYENYCPNCGAKMDEVEDG